MMNFVDDDRTVRLVLADVAATIGPGYESIVRANARRVRQLTDDPDDYLRQLVEGTQQDLHDGFVDTDWPKCPLHRGRHPLWFREGGWCCEQSRVRIAAVGQLAASRGPQ